MCGTSEKPANFLKNKVNSKYRKLQNFYILVILLEDCNLKDNIIIVYWLEKWNQTIASINFIISKFHKTNKIQNSNLTKIKILHLIQLLIQFYSKLAPIALYFVRNVLERIMRIIRKHYNNIICRSTCWLHKMHSTTRISLVLLSIVCKKC